MSTRTNEKSPHMKSANIKEAGLRVTIKSIAKDLGISHMTVSRALAGSPNVSAATREQIVARARELGYVKNSAANAMRGEPTAIIGLLLPNITNEFYARFANSLAILCADHGLDVVIHLTNDDEEREHQALQRLQALQAATVIMVPTSQSGPGHPAPASPIRIIELIRTRDQSASDGQLLIDDGPAIEAAVEHLLATGRRRIGYIGAGAPLSSGRGRAAAFRSALQRNGFDADPTLMRTAPPSFQMGLHNTNSLLDGADPPDGLICGGFEISNGALEACLQRGIEFPGQLAFVGYGDPAAYKWIAGGITTIALSTEDIVARAMHAIEDVSGTQAATSSLSPTELILRNSA